MKKLTFLLSVLMVSLTSVFAAPYLNLDEHFHDFGTVSVYPGETATGSYDILLDMDLEGGQLAEPAILGELDGAEFEAEYAENTDEDPVVRISFTATKAGTYKDTIVVASGVLTDTVAVQLTVEMKASPVITVASSYAFGNVAFADAKKGATGELDASVTAGTLSAEVIGTDANAFSASVLGTKLVITFKPANVEVRGYDATVVLSAPYAESKEVAVNAYVLMPKPEISVTPDAWKTEALIVNGSAKAEKVFSISGLYLFSQPQGAIQGGQNSPFKWVAAENKVTFTGTEKQAYKDTLIISADNADPVKVALEVNVKRPVIEADEDELDFGTISLPDALSGNVAPKTTDVYIKTGASLSVKVAPAGAPFTAKIEDGQLIVSFKASTVGPFEAKAIISAADADDLEVALKANVSMPTAEIKVLPAAWKDTVEMVNGVAKANRQFSIIPLYVFTEPEVTIQGGAKSPFAWDKANSQVTFEAWYKEATYQDTMIISAMGAADVKVPLEITVVPTSVPYVAVTGIKLDQTAAEMEVGDIIALNATVEPANAINKAITWETSNAAVATIDNGLVTAMAKGSATIIVRTADGNFAATCNITVKEKEVPVVPVAVTGVTLDKATASIEIGKTVTLTATVAPANADNKAVTWATSDAAIATVANGVVTGVAKGTATITVKTVDGGFTATCAVTVTDGSTPPTPTGTTDVITYATTGMKGETKAYGDFTITGMTSGASYIVHAYDGEGMNYIQMRSKNNNSGLVSTVSGGTVQSVEIKFNEKTTDRKVNVYGSNTAFTSPTELYADGPVLVGTIAADAADKKLTFTDSYQYVGIRSLDGAIYMDEIDITWGGTTPVTPVAVTGVTLDKTTASIEEGKTVTLTATVAPADATNKAVTWESSNTAVATVANGVVKGVAKGTATITVKTVDGGFTATCAITVTEGSTPPTPTGKVDKITYVETGLKDLAKSGYQDATITNMPSGSEYLINGNCGVEYIQMRTNNNNSGLVTTKSAGSVLSVEIKFNAKTTDRKVNVYGSATAFTSPTQLYADGPTLIGTIGAADANKKLAINGSYQYIGIRSAEGAIYMDEIDIEYGDFVEIPTTTLKFKTATAEVEVGKTVTLEVVRDGNDAMTWATSDASVATVANGVVTGVKEGTVKITATANNISDECTVTVTKAVTPSEIPVKSIAEFIAAQGGKCKLIGIVGTIDNDLYGNFNLTDNSGTIYVYGLLTPEGESKKFSTLGVAEGDTLTVIAETYKLYNDKPEVVNAIFVEVHKGGGVTPTPSGEKLDVNYAEAAYLEDEEGPFWEIFAAKLDEASYSLDYPLIILDIDNKNKTRLSGEYNVFYAALYTSENDSIEFVDSKVVVYCVELAADEMSAPIYHFIATLHDEAGKEYVYEFETEVWAYDGMNSTDEDIIWIDLEDPVQGIEDIEVTIDINTPIYNIMGQRVGRNTPGILIQNGRKFMINGL